MGRKRNVDKHLPRRVYLKHGAYYFVTPEQKWIRLGITEAEMHRALAQMLDDAPFDRLNAVFDRYEREVLPTKAPRTQQDNRAELANLRLAFGHMRPSALKTKHVYAYLDARGQTARVRANRERSLLSHVYKYAIRWGLVEHNPCAGVMGHKETPRRRYVTDEDYLAVHQLASPIIQSTMEVAIITGMRQGDILSLQRHQLQDDGIHVTPAKTKDRTGRKQIFEWTPGLRAAINQALALPRRLATTWVIANTHGQPYTRNGFKAMFGKLMTKALEDGLLQERFTFHDLRAKAGSEAEDGMRLLGHQSPATTRRIYERKPDRVKPIR
ncbi:integrase [Methylolobus aquaticus]|nr:integrase [Methylolobus aquaticus]